MTDDRRHKAVSSAGITTSNSNAPNFKEIAPEIPAEDFMTSHQYKSSELKPKTITKRKEMKSA